MRFRVFIALSVMLNLATVGPKLGATNVNPEIVLSEELALDALGSAPRTFIQDLRNTQVIKQLGIQNGNSNNYTLFLPTDEAMSTFGHMGDIRSPAFAGSGSAANYEKFVRYHLVRGVYNAREIHKHGILDTFASKGLDTKTIPPVQYSIQTKNGIIHVIAGVLVHPDFTDLARKYATAIASQKKK